jgi:Flp pilus assembly protein TadD
LLGGVALAVSGGLAVLSCYLAGWVGPDLLTGLLWAGGLMLGLGLNLLVKHIPVRRYFEARGIRIRGEDRVERFADFPALPVRTENSRLEKATLAADRSLSWRRLGVARDQYTAIMADPEWTTLPARHRAAVHLNRGVVFRQLGKQRAALTDCHQAAVLNPRNPGPHLNTATLLAQDLHQFGPAHVAISRAVECDPGNPECFSTRGIIRLELGDHSGAEADLRTALELDPHNANALSNLGTYFFQHGRLGEAVGTFRRALEEAPHDAEIRCNYAQALARTGAEEEARAVLRQDWRAQQLWVKKFRRLP